MLKFHKWLYKRRIDILILIGVLLPVVLSLLVFVIDLHLFGILSNDDYDPISQIEENPFLLLALIIFGPLLETTIQYIPVKISCFALSKYKYANCLAIALSAIIFGILHHPGLLYFISLSFAGFVWASICFILIRRRFYPYPIVAAIHALYNTSILGLCYL